jgi:LPXTG-motif cell wall-anchored protein
MMQGQGFTLKRAGGLAGLAGALTLIGALATSQAAAAAGNPSFEGILSAAAPTGFTSSPASYDVSSGPVTVDFNVVATNLTGEPQTFALNLSADHILTDNGANVADGQPGQAGIAFSGPTGTTQAQIAGSQSFSQTWAPNATDTLSLTYTFDACGYFQVDVWAPWKDADNSRGRATLASGFIRILGCDANADPSPSASPSPVGAAPSSPTPDGGVQAITTTPSTGAGDGWLTIGGGLLLAGAGMVAVGARRRRFDI